MKFKLVKASDADYKETIEINTLQELLDIINQSGGQVVITNYDGWKIDIYDDYRE